MALKGLKKSDRPDAEDAAASFIEGAQKRIEAHAPAVAVEGERVFERYTFSLTHSTSDEIDRLSLVPRAFRVSRSDIVKAGVEALRDLSEAELTALVMKVKKAK